jgi:hypothetical protein
MPGQPGYRATMTILNRTEAAVTISSGEGGPIDVAVPPCGVTVTVTQQEHRPNPLPPCKGLLQPAQHEPAQPLTPQPPLLPSRSCAQPLLPDPRLLTVSPRCHARDPSVERKLRTAQVPR